MVTLDFSLLGYKFNDGKMEEQEQYLKRISGLQRLYSAVLITKLRRSQQHADHPHGLENGWIWLSNSLMLDPLPGISSTLLLEFIQICGTELWQAYKKQFMKLMIVLHEQYIFRLDKVKFSWHIYYVEFVDEKNSIYYRWIAEVHIHGSKIL